MLEKYRNESKYHTIGRAIQENTIGRAIKVSNTLMGV